METQDEITVIIAAIVAIVGAYFALTAQQQSTITAGIATIIAAIIAYWQARKQTTTTAALTSGTVESQTPAIIASLPERTWKMTDSTKEWCTFDATPANKATILAQIADAEAQHLTHYQVHFSGGYYIIDYGLLMGGAGNPSGK